MSDLIPTEVDFPVSYWHATSEAMVPDGELPAEAAVVVVGGGLLGCWTAYWLAKAGVDVTLLEASKISWGATGRNGGFLTGGAAMSYGESIDRFGADTARDLWTIAADGQRMAAEVIAEEGIDCDYRQAGTLSLALNDESLAAMQRSQGLMSDGGFAGEVIDRQQVQGLIDTPLGPEITGAVWYAKSGLLHSARYLVGVARAAERHGARLVQARVEQLDASGDEVQVVTDRGVVAAGRVVVALNAWSDTLVPDVAGKIVPVRGQILAYEPTERVFTPGMGTDVTPTGEYWQQTLDGSIVIGGCRSDAPNGDVGVREMMPTTDVTARIEAVIPRLFPELSGLPVARHWAGLMAFTADYVPVADAVPSMPNVWVTGGYCGHGMPFGASVGKLLAEAAESGETPAGLRPLRLGRETLGA